MKIAIDAYVLTENEGNGTYDTSGLKKNSLVCLVVDKRNRLTLKCCVVNSFARSAQQCARASGY